MENHSPRVLKDVHLILMFLKFFGRAFSVKHQVPKDTISVLPMFGPECLPNSLNSSIASSIELIYFNKRVLSSAS